MYLQLQGKFLTPLITKSTKFHLKGCKARIKAPKRRYINKITVGKPMFPYSFIGYLGKLELSFKCQSKQKAERKLLKLVQIENIGRFAGEGFGKVEWHSGSIIDNYPLNTKKKSPKIRIRKGLPRFLPQHVQNLLKYSLLHDFFHTKQHRSKIYVEPNIHDNQLIELLRQHHEKTENEVIKQFQRYNRISAIITRKIYSPRTNRYNWGSTKNIDFQALGDKIKVVTNNIWGLYRFIYESKELASLNESLTHGHTSLRQHLLLMANLIVHDFKNGTLK